MKSNGVRTRLVITHAMRTIIGACVLVSIVWAQKVTRAQVVTVIPEQNAINVNPNSTISVTFDDGMDPATINDTTFLVFGELSGMHTGTITYNNITNTATLNPDVDLITGEFHLLCLRNLVNSGVAK